MAQEIVVSKPNRGALWRTNDWYVANNGTADFKCVRNSPGPTRRSVITGVQGHGHGGFFDICLIRRTGVSGSNNVMMDIAVGRTVDNPSQTSATVDFTHDFGAVPLYGSLNMSVLASIDLIAGTETHTTILGYDEEVDM